MSKSLIRKAKNVVNGYSTIQVLVREATSNDPEGPSPELLDVIAERSYDSVEFFELMDMLDKRLNDKGKNWRHVAKSLTTLDYLVRDGSENCVLWCKENLYLIKTLREFMHEDEMGQDQGQLVRIKAKELTSLLLDEERLREEREMRSRNRRPRRRRTSNGYDDDLQRALEESRITAEEEEAERRRRQEGYGDGELETALQLSKEEEELRRLRQMQQQQRVQQPTGYMFAQPTQPAQPMYYDIFGNPISAEEYLQFQQQQAQQAQQELAMQQYQQQMAEQQYLAQQQAFLQQQQQQQQFAQSQMPLPTGSNNPFALGNGANQNSTPVVPAAPARPPTEPLRNEQAMLQQPLKQTRTGNQSISDKYSELNNLLASGTGIDTFGNTGDARVPAQHTKTGTFINSQGTGYKQVSNEPKNNPFLGTQYTGLPSTSIAPAYTGYGFGNQSSQPSQHNRMQQGPTPDQGVSLIDL